MCVVCSAVYVVCLVFQGKFIRINFDVSGYISGANIETCILDLLQHCCVTVIYHIVHNSNS